MKQRSSSSSHDDQAKLDSNNEDLDLKLAQLDQEIESFQA